jgi:hypothetical protein
MLRAFEHYAFKNHELRPAECAGCLEAAAFLTIRGYEGNTEYPTCVVVYEGDPGHYRDERSGLKHRRNAVVRRYGDE